MKRKESDEISVLGSGEKPDGWLRDILTECSFRYRYRYFNVRQLPVKCDSISTSTSFFHANPKAIILTENLQDLVSWSRAITHKGQAPVLWALSDLNLDTLDLITENEVEGILTRKTDALSAICSIKIAIANWQREMKHRKAADKALADLYNRKQIEKAKGVLMNRFGLSEADAFTRIRSEAMRSRKRMVEIAETILLLENI